MKETKLKIFCEGITDQIFLADFIEKTYSIKFNREKRKNKFKIDIKSNSIDIIEIGGCEKLKNPIYHTMLLDNLKTGGKNIVIFDADQSNQGNNGYINCKRKLEDLSSKYSFDYYIWPDNQSDGEIEDLLRKLVCSEKEPIFSCMEEHANCLNTLSNFSIRKPGIKEKINFYLHTCNQSTASNERSYLSEEYWNLNPEEIPLLKKLKSMLDSYLRDPSL